jgi:hypothetical protein
MSKKLLLCLLLSSTTAYAEDSTEDYLLLGQWSRHHKQGNLYNQTHGLVGFERNNYSVGYYTNSYNDPSWFVGYSQKYTPNSMPFAQFKLNYVAVTGYSIPVVPIIAPSVTLGKGLIQMDVSYIPMVATTVGFRINITDL